MSEDELASGETMGVREAAEVLGVHPNTLRIWGAAGRLRETRVGTRGDRRYSRSDVEALKARLEVAQEDRSRATPDPSAALAAVYGSGLGDLMASYQLAQTMFARNYGYVAELARSISAVTVASRHIVPLSQMVSQMLLPSPGILASVAAAQRSLTVNTDILASVAAPQRNLTVNPGILASVAAAQRNLTVSPGILAVISQQQKMASVMAEMARTFQPRYAALLVEALGPARRAFASVNEIAEAAMGGLAVQRASAILTAFRGFTDGLAERLPSADISEAESGLAVGQLGVGSEVLESGVGSLRGLIELGPAAEVDDQQVLNVFDSILGEVDSRRSKLILLTPSEIAKELQQLSVVRVSVATVRLLQARTRCNRAAQLARGEPIFKATTETEDAAATLPLMIADDDKTFREIIDRLYKLLYESSGYFARITPEFLKRYEVLFDVKHLRTHYFHDVDHGEPSEIRRKLRRPGEIFTRLVGATVPRDGASWRRAQLGLITALADALDDLEDEASQPTS